MASVWPDGPILQQQDTLVQLYYTVRPNLTIKDRYFLLHNLKVCRYTRMYVKNNNGFVAEQLAQGETIEIFETLIKKQQPPLLEKGLHSLVESDAWFHVIADTIGNFVSSSQ